MLFRSEAGGEGEEEENEEAWARGFLCCCCCLFAGAGGVGPSDPTRFVLSSPEKEKWFTTQRPFSCIFQSADMSRLSRHPGQAACLLVCVRAGGRIRHSREHNHKRVTRTALGFRKEQQLVNSESNVGYLVPHCSPSEPTWAGELHFASDVPRAGDRTGTATPSNTKQQQ